MNIFTKFSLKNSFVIFLLVVMLIGGGIYSSTQINLEVMPDISIPMITTVVTYPGASPEDISEKVVNPLQKSLSGIQEIKNLKSTAAENVCFLIAEFDYSQDMEKAKRLIEDAVKNVKLPDQAKISSVSRAGFGKAPVVTYSLQYNLKNDELKTFLDEKLVPNLSGINGVASVEVQGLNESNVYIELDNQKLKDHGLTLQDVKNALLVNQISIPAGQVKMGDNVLPVKVSKKTNSLEDLKSVPILVMPNTSKLVTENMENMGKGMGELGEAVGEMGEVVGQLGQNVKEIGQSVGVVGNSMGQLSEAVGTNSQAVALLSVVQKSEAVILASQGVLSNPQSSLQEKAKAKETILQQEKIIQGALSSLDKLLNTQKVKGAGKSPVNQSEKALENKSKAPLKNSMPKSKDKKSLSSSAVEPVKPTIGVVYLKDLGNVVYRESDKNTYSRTNLKDNVVVEVYKTDDANTVTIADDTQDVLDALAKTNPEIKIEKIDDKSTLVKTSVKGMVKEGILGALFAALVIAFFLRDLRATIIAITSIPLSILIALILMPQFGITLNTMSLGGIAVAVGRIVDDSIVVIENIYRRAAKENDNMEQLIESATKEVGSAITSSTITTVAVFLPLTFVSGMVGKVFAPFAITVVICILASLLVAVTVVPAMSRRMLKNYKPRVEEEKESILVRFYKKVLEKVLNHKIKVLAILLLFLLGTLSLFPMLGVQFMPTENTKVLSATMTLKPGMAVEKTNEMAMKFEKFLMERKDVSTVVCAVGEKTAARGMSLSMRSSNGASFTIILEDSAEIEVALKEISDKAKEFSKEDVNLVVKAQSITGQSEKLEIIVNGKSLEDIKTASNLITEELKGINDISNISNNLSDTKAEIAIEVDSEKAAEKGMSPTLIAGSVRNVLNFENVETISDQDKDVQVYLGFQGDSIDEIKKIENLELRMGENTLKLKDVAVVKKQEGPVTISELNENQYAAISADVKGNNTGGAANEALAKIDAIQSKLPSGITYSIDGSAKNIRESFNQLTLAIIIAIFAVYIVMVLAFGEGKAPFAILFSLPFAISGAILALLISGQSLSISGMIGILMLIGIVVTNAIVLLDRVQTNIKNGMSVKDALLEAGAVRLRPILMTAIATIMALIPLAMGSSEGTIISQSLGIVVIGGLLVSTLITLIIVPLMYSLLYREKKTRQFN